MREDLKLRLLNAAISRGIQKSHRMTAFTTTELTNFINAGVDRMSSAEYASDLSRQTAENNLMRLIDAMSLDSRRRSLNEDMDYTSFNTASKSVCPLWPFC